MSPVVVTAALLGSTTLAGGLLTWRGRLGPHLLPVRDLLHRSARADLFLVATKRALRAVWAFPAALGVAGIGQGVHALLLRGFATPPSLHEGGWWLAAMVASLAVSSDFTFYWYHRALHENPYLWELHKVHHSAERMVGITTARVHPIDDLLYYTLNGAFTGILYGAWLLVIVPPDAVTVLGLGITVWVNAATLNYLHHWHFPLSLGPLDRVLVSPHYHHLHHSIDPVHFNRNYGNILIVWDRLFGSVREPEPGEDFAFGLGVETESYRSGWRLYVVPLVRIAALLRRRFARATGPLLR